MDGGYSYSLHAVKKPKRKKRYYSNQSRKKKAENIEDQTSKLPEPLLVQILSFLPMRDSVQTSFLSNRWRNLWTYVETLDLDFELGFSHVGFVNFTNRWLSLHQGSRIQKFRLCFDFAKEYTADVDRWIDFALRKEVQKLDLNFLEAGRKYELPGSIFCAERLSMLRLSFCILKLPEGFKGFKFLKRLSLSNIEFSNKLIEELICGCLLLEEFEMVGCVGLTRLRILPSMNLERLKRLAIHRCRIFNGLEIDAPNLLSLSISETVGFKGAEYSLRNISSLNYACIGLGFCFEWESDECKSKPILEMLLEDLSHTKALELGSLCIQALSLWELRNLRPPISERKCLILQTGLKKWELPGIASLLRTSPNLEILAIKIVPTFHPNFDEEFMQRYDFDKGRYWESLTSLFPCLVHNLKHVKMLDFMGGGLGSSIDSKVVSSFLNKQEKKIKLVRFLLKNALVLEKMAIHIFDKPQFMKVEEWPKLLLEVTQKILAFPRASSCAEVLVSYK